MCEKVVCGQVVCEQVVCVRKLCVSADKCVDKLCVSKLCVRKLCVGRRRRTAAGGGGECRIENKNPTQRCGEKTKQFRETSFKNGKLRADGLVPMRFAIFPFHLSEKYCPCREKVMPGHTKCCTCHTKSS